MVSEWGLEVKDLEFSHEMGVHHNDYSRRIHHTVAAALDFLGRYTLFSLLITQFLP